MFSFFKSVDSIVRDITRKAEQLEQVAAKRIEQAVAHETKAQFFVALAHAARTEHARATRLIGRFKELVE